MAEALERPHVVMLVCNNVTIDTRVRKSALAVAALGARVTVVGTTPERRRSSSRLGDVTIVRVPVDYIMRNRRLHRRARLRQGRLDWLVTDPVEEAYDRRRLALAHRDAALHGGLYGRLNRSLLDARRLSVRAAGVGRRRAVQGAMLAFKAYDRGMQHTGVAASPERIVPEVGDYEMAFGPVIDELEPDVIHAHDMHFLAVVGRAVARARAAGRPVPWVYDAHEWVPGLSRHGARTVRVVAAWAALERRWADKADRVITVSPPLARALADRYHLARTPDVVLNVPPLGAHGVDASSLRQVLADRGVGPDTPLLVYSGGVQPARGVSTAVAALRHLPQVHLAVVAVPSVTAPGALAVRNEAHGLGVGSRVHLVAPVATDQVAAFLSSADVGLIPLRHFGSHEMALANKLFEYLHARLPMVVSDCRAQAEFVREHDLGEVHTADDAADLAAAVERVMARRGEIRARMADPALTDRYTWQAQAEVLQQVYRDLLPGWPVRGVEEARAALTTAEPPETQEPDRAHHATLAIGPANSAGQAWAWARSAERHLEGVTGHVVAIRNDAYDYPADELVSRKTYRDDVDWQLRALARAGSSWTHVLLEAGRPMLGSLTGRDFLGDAQLLRRGGVEVGLVFHGSEVRDPRRHRLSHEFSPFADRKSALTRRLQARCDALLPRLRNFTGPLFASTPDQLEYLPDRAQWLPVVVDTEAFAPGPPVMERARPLVVHLASNPALKGTEHVERVLRPMAERGLIELRVVTGLPPAEAAELVRSADIVVDQLLLGLYGVLACEAMASGRVVVGHLGEDLRSLVELPVPVVEATPRSLGAVVQRLLDDRDEARTMAKAGPEFVHELHDGRRSAQVLAPFLGVEVAAP